MKKYAIYIGILIIGLVLGSVFFGDKSEMRQEHQHSSSEQQWTCSMHPNIMQSEAGSCPICGMDLIPVKVGSEGLRVNEFKLTKNAMMLADIQSSTVGNGQFSGASIILSGKIEANQDANVVQASYFSGRIERLNISSIGERVRKGQLLATIYSPELFSAQQELITAFGMKESQPDLYRAVRNKLKLWKISDRQINQIETTGKVIQNFPVYATVSGTVSDKLVDQGDYVSQGQALLKITNLSTVWALFDVYENQIDQLKPGQSITVTTSAYPNKEFKRKIDFIDPMMNQNTRTLGLRVVLDNAKGEFKTGMFVKGELQNKDANSDQKLTIPSSAVLWTGERSVVYLRTNPSEPIFEMRQISLGKQLGENYEVLEGLDFGDEIVTNGAFTVDAAAQLQGKKSMMNAEGGKTSIGHEGHGRTSEHSVSQKSENHLRPTLSFSEDFQKRFEKVLESYLEMKDALVASDAKRTSEFAKTAVGYINRIDQKNLGAQESELLTKSNNYLEAMEKNPDLVQQRAHFVLLNEQLLSIVDNLKLTNTYYIQECPMANDNKGGKWLSLENKILNPYFGEAMLQCGSVLSKIN